MQLVIDDGVVCNVVALSHTAVKRSVDEMPVKTSKSNDMILLLANGVCPNVMQSSVSADPPRSVVHVDSPQTNLVRVLSSHVRLNDTWNRISLTPNRIKRSDHMSLIAT